VATRVGERARINESVNAADVAAAVAPVGRLHEDVRTWRFVLDGLLESLSSFLCKNVV
jgi:hypothetical protein